MNLATIASNSIAPATRPRATSRTSSKSPDEAVARYLDCGIPETGLARMQCDTCRRERLLSFSRKNWAALVRCVYEVDPLGCPCGATMRIVRVITERSAITKILAHLGKVAAATATEGAGPVPYRATGPVPDPSVN